MYGVAGGNIELDHLHVRGAGVHLGLVERVEADVLVGAGGEGVVEHVHRHVETVRPHAELRIVAQTAGGVDRVEVPAARHRIAGLRHREALERARIPRREIGFTCAGSCDYLSGQSFAFVMNLEAVGAWPPISESHVEMDGAWALYEAWVKILTGEVDTAFVYGFGKSSAGQLRRVLALQLDPYTVGPLWPDAVSIAGLQARLGIDSGLWTERDMAEVAARSRAANPDAQVHEQVTADELLARPYVANPLRKHDCAPVTDGAAVVILAAADRAKDLCARPTRITSIQHRVESANLGARDLTTSPSTVAAATAATTLS